MYELQEFTNHQECSDLAKREDDQGREACVTEHKTVTVTLRELLGEMSQDEKLMPCNPTSLYDAMSMYLGITRNEQHERLSETSMTLEGLKDTDSIFKCIVNALADDTDPIARKASQLWSIEKRHSVTCLGCNRTQQLTFDKANDVRVYMNEDEPRDLQGYMNQYSESFTVSDCRCADCGTATKARVESSITSLPRVLCVILSRVKNIGSASSNIIKDETLFEFPEILDLSPILVDSSQQAFDRHIYELYGVIAHAGSHDHGHYTAYVMHKEQWYLADDTRVTRCSWEFVRRTYQSSQNGVAYMLMYRKTCKPSNLMCQVTKLCGLKHIQN